MVSEGVLIVDDDEDLCEQLAEAMKDEGFAVKHTSDPYHAQALIQDFYFDTVILDYKMPGMTGVELLKVIKDRFPSTKIFLTSGRPFIEKILLENNVSHLVTEVIKKPFDVSLLFEKLRLAP